MQVGKVGIIRTNIYKMCTCLQTFPLQKFNLQCYTCTAILCLHIEAEGNSTNVLSSWHRNVDTQFHLSFCFTNYVYETLKSHHHSCKKIRNKLNGTIVFIWVSKNPRHSYKVCASSRSVASFNCLWEYVTMIDKSLINTESCWHFYWGTTGMI